MGFVVLSLTPLALLVAQRLNQQPGGLHGTDLGLLHVCYSCVAGSSYGIPTVGAGAASASVGSFLHPIPHVLPYPSLK